MNACQGRHGKDKDIYNLNRYVYILIDVNFKLAVTRHIYTFSVYFIFRFISVTSLLIT